MGFDKPFVKRALAKPGHIANLLRIKGDCYTKIGDLKADLDDDAIARAKMIAALAENSKNLLAFKWKNIL